MPETLDLFKAALVSGEPWQGDPLGFRRGAGPGWICTWISRRGARFAWAVMTLTDVPQGLLIESPHWWLRYPV